MPAALRFRNLIVGLAVVVTVVLIGDSFTGDARAQTLPLPPGTVLTGPVFKAQFSCPPPSVPSITTGADANIYILPSPACVATPSFVATAPAAMVVTSAPTQFVRVYCPDPGCSPVSAPNRPFMADPSTIRGLTPAQIKDALALPGTPTMITIVTVPAGSCVLVGQGAPAFGGSSGLAQEWAAGMPSGPDCAGLQFLPASDYINRQAIGAAALLYGPSAGGGNPGAVAAALDRGPYPAPYTEMDGIYKSLDLLNFGEPAPLRSALAQLDGEIYADIPAIAIGAGQLFLGAVRAQMHAGDQGVGPSRQWLSGIGAGGTLAGNGNSHDLDSTLGGIAGGIEHRFGSALSAGVAIGWIGGDFKTDGLSGSGSTSAFAIAPYMRFAQDAWYFESTLGYEHDAANVDRAIVFPGVGRMAGGSPRVDAFLSQIEAGYNLNLDARTSIAPFAALQGIVIGQHGFVEHGAGAVDLHVSDQTAALALSTLGAELAYALPLDGDAPLRLSGRLGWAHDFVDPQRTSTAYFEGTPSLAQFTVAGAPALRDVVVFGAGIAQSLPSFDLVLHYEGTAGEGSIMQSGTAGIRFTF